MHVKIFLIFLFISNLSLAQQNEFKPILITNKVYSVIKYYNPVRNYKKIEWDELLVDLVNDSRGLKNDSSLIELLNKRFKPFNKKFIFSLNKLNIDSLNKKQSKITHFYYEHLGCGFEAGYFGFNKPSYFSCIKKVVSTDSLFQEYSSYIEFKLDDNLFFYFTYPSSLIKINYTPKNKVTKKLLLNATNLNYRIASLLKVFNIISIFKIDTNFNKTNFENKLFQSLVQTKSDKSIIDFYNTMNHFLSFINDGHAQFNLGYRTGIMAYSKSKYFPKFTTQIIQNRIFIKDIDSTLATKLIKGDEILQANNISSETLIKQKMQTVSANTIGYKVFKVNDCLFESFKQDSIFEFEIKREDSIFKLATKSNNFFQYQKSNIAYSEPIMFLDDSIAYINLTSSKLSVKQIQKNAAKFNAAKGIIFDLRGYPSYKTDKILALFIDKTITTANFKIPIISQPNNLNTKYDVSNWSINPNQIIKNKYYVITDMTVSWGETILEMIKRYKIATIIGGISAGTNGDVASVSLPIGYFWITGLLIESNGINPLPVKPDYLYEPTIYDFINSENDLYIEQTKKIINGK